MVDETFAQAWANRVIHLENTTTNRVEGTHARSKRSHHDSMGDLCKHMFNSLLYNKLRGFVSREAQDILFHELQRIDTMGIDCFPCDCTLKVNHGLPCTCELKQLISIYGSISLMSSHMLSICSSKDTGDSWVNLILTHEVDALLKRFSQLDSVNLHFQISLQCVPLQRKLNNGASKSVKSARRKPSMLDHCPGKLQQYIMNAKDVILDGNYCYRTITSLLGQGDESWSTYLGSKLDLLST
ncbi:hypothetical protein HKD37_20G057839 [Glycine soja]